MTDSQIEAIRQFINNHEMSGAVKEVLITAFLKARPEKDVHYLAAKSLSVEFLEDAWRELNTHKVREPEKETKIVQVGL